MIVNFQYRFVLLHIPKTGGSSIAATLKRDVPDNYQRLHRILTKLGLPGIRRHLAASPHTKHETYQEFLELFEQRTGLSASVALSLYPIAFVRHPLSRFISLHRYLLAQHEDDYPEVPEDINDWAAIVEDNSAPYLARIRSLRTQSSYVHGVDKSYFLGKFETIEEDIVRLGHRLSITLNLPHLNQSSKQPAGKNNWDELSDRSINFLKSKYRDDFSNFNYETR